MTINLPPDLVIPGLLVGLSAWLVVHVAFAFGVVYDAKRLPGRRDPTFVGRWTWFLTVLAGGPFLRLHTGLFITQYSVPQCTRPQVGTARRKT